MSKYYMAHNAGNRTIGGERFEVTEIVAGTTVGVFEATTDQQIQKLDAVVKDKASAAWEIDKVAYEDARKKKAPSFNSFQHSNFPKQPQQTALKEVVGVVVEESQPEDHTEQERVESVKGALGSVGKVDAPPQPEEPVKKKK